MLYAVTVWTEAGVRLRGIARSTRRAGETHGVWCAWALRASRFEGREVYAIPVAV